LSTIESTLSCCGKPLRRWQRGRWRTVYGWQDLHPVRYPTLGTRWFADCDIPDLQLFPDRYAVLLQMKNVPYRSGGLLTGAGVGYGILRSASRSR
jgi:hypothetical protein